MNLKYIYNLPGGDKIRKLIIKKEGGEKTSNTLRYYTKQKYNVSVDLYTYGSCFAPTFNTGGHVKIARYCSFGSDIHYFGSNHPLNHAIMSAYFYNKKFSGFDVKDVERKQLYVGNDVWIGHGSTILSSCEKIGNGAVIGAGSVVTKDVPPYAIVVGAPARVIRYRFDQITITALENSCWWEMTPEELMKFYSLIDAPLKWATTIIESRNKVNVS